jgi:hypothetical protein
MSYITDEGGGDVEGVGYIYPVPVGGLYEESSGKDIPVSRLTGTLRVPQNKIGSLDWSKYSTSSGA